MKTISFATCAAVAAAVALGAAQAPSSRSDGLSRQAIPEPSPVAEPPEAVTVVGCLEPAEGHDLVPTDWRGAKYVLTHAVPAQPADLDTSSAVRQPNSAAGADADAAETYLVVRTEADVPLALHLHHKVELTGLVGGDVIPPTTHPPEAPAVTAPRTKVVVASVKMRTLDVMGVKMLSSKCAE